MAKSKTELTNDTTAVVKDNGGADTSKTIGIELRNLLIDFVASIVQIDDFNTIIGDIQAEIDALGTVPDLQQVVEQGNTVEDHNISVINSLLNSIAQLSGTLLLIRNNDNQTAGVQAESFFIDNSPLNQSIVMRLGEIVNFANNFNKKLLFGTATDERLIELPDNSGTLALLSDIAGATTPAVPTISIVRRHSNEIRPIYYPVAPYIPQILFGERFGSASLAPVCVSNVQTIITASINNIVAEYNLGNVNQIDTFTTTALLSNFTAPELELVTGIITATITPILTTISLPKLKFAGGINITAVSLNLPELEAIGTTGFTFNTNNTYSCPNLRLIGGLFTYTSTQPFVFNNLEKIAGFNIGSTVLGTISLPNLKSCINPSGVFQISNNNITSIDCPLLEEVISQNFTISGTSITSINLSALKVINVQSGSGITISTSNAAITSLNLSSLVSVVPQTNAGVGSSTFSLNTPTITNLQFGTIGVTKNLSGTDFSCIQALNQASVDRLLAVLVSLDGTNGTTLYGSGRTVNLGGGSAAPSAAGLANKAILQSRGATVTTN